MVQVRRKDGADGVPGGHDIDSGVPEAHEREHECGGVREGPVGGPGVGDGVDSVSGGGDLYEGVSVWLRIIDAVVCV